MADTRSFRQKYCQSRGAWLPVGMGIGISLGIACDNLAMGTALGVVLGLALQGATRPKA